MAKPYTLEDSLRNLDEAIYNWLGTFRIDYRVLDPVDQTRVILSKAQFPILRVFASPQRAFAATADLLVSEGWIDGDSPEVQRARAEQDWPVLPLPVISIERDDPIISNELANPSARWRAKWFNKETREWEEHPYPLHYLTQYRLNFWCEKKYTHAAFFEWLLAQLGNRGSAQSETFITVNHPVPWGPQIHQLHYLGSGDMSDLEGNDARHIRSQLSFTLRSWAFKPATHSAPPVYVTREDYDLSDGSVEPYPNDGYWWTSNLFNTFGITAAEFPTVWPKAGMAEAALVGESAIHAKVAVPSDTVMLARADVTAEQFGRTVWSVSACFQSSAPFAVEATQFDENGVETVIGLLHVQKLDDVTNMHRFFVCTGREFSISVAGDMSQAEVLATNIDVRQIFDGARIVPTGSSVDGGAVTYYWTGLDRRPYLMVAVGLADGSAIFADDSASPENTVTDAFDDDEGIGAARVMMPVNSTLRLTLPPGSAPVAVYAQVFDAPFTGSRL